MAKNLSEVFKETNEILWNGEEGSSCEHQFICITMHKLPDIPSYLLLKAKLIISNRLGMSKSGYYHTVVTWLDENEICKKIDQDSLTIQKYRKAWLTELEKEFKEI